MKEVRGGEVKRGEGGGAGSLRAGILGILSAGRRFRALLMGETSRGAFDQLI